MAITLVGGSGLFNLMGKGLGVLGVGTSLTAPDANYYRSVNLLAKFNALDTVYAGMSGAGGRQSGAWVFPGLSSMQTNVGGYLRTLGSNLATSVQEMANDDTPLPSLTNFNALSLLIRQMKASSDSVQGSAPSVAAKVAVGSPAGNPVFAASVLGPDGLTLQYVYPDALTLTCTSDSATGSTAGQEALSIVGRAAVSDPYAAEFPGGAGISTSLTLVDARAAGSSTGNLLSNSDFETWTGYPNPPDNWTLEAGSTAGTDVIRGASAYTGSFDLQLASGTASTTLAGVYQPFGTATSPLPGGTPQTLAGAAVYAVNFATKVSAVPAAGVLDVELTDGGGTVLTDAQGVACRVRVTLSSETTSYTTHTGFVRTPSPPTALPATTRCRVRLSTALDTGKSVHVDHLAITPAAPLYSGGPYVAAFSMSANTLRGDTWTVAVTSGMGLMQLGFEKVFGMRALGLTLPFSNSPTIAESLIA